jgi:hypothetical protein
MQWEMAAYELLVLVNNRRWELVLGHCRAMIALHGWRLASEPSPPCLSPF